MSLAPASGEKRIVLCGVSWETYQALVAETRRSGVRFTYDQGSLEIMCPSSEHECIKKLLARLLEMMAFELRIPTRGAGSMTLANELAERGVEPDECYYVVNEPRIRGKREIDLATDPPPDLAIEIDISSSSLDQLPIYASVGVPEVWLCHGTAIRVYVLQPDGTYARREQSTVFPLLPIARLQGFLDQQDSVDEYSLVRSFVEWVRTLESSDA